MQFPGHFLFLKKFFSLEMLTILGGRSSISSPPLCTPKKAFCIINSIHSVSIVQCPKVTRKQIYGTLDTGSPTILLSKVVTLHRKA
ncbi:hypothetical protein GDO78_009955 [Eleutherodactylus coqui]|uniref:Uncharacterized protein n=1 Tax=Eleutherodactylus coqui TaxID=57060 RepID=A0A8J6FB06_ELECQ|nr:hypothetical protein GDO78_009955 [Eleutherodactylus coqui]